MSLLNQKLSFCLIYQKYPSDFMFLI